MANNELTFDSKCYPDGKILNLACGFISLNSIDFINEKTVVLFEAKTGEVTFCDASSAKILSAKVALPGDGDEKFSEIKCIVEDGCIKLATPIYDYKDNYPNCDGEYDRWTKIVIGFDTVVCFDYVNKVLVK